MTPGAQELSIAKQRRHSAEGCAVADTGRDGDERYAGQATDDRGQRALHTGDDDEAVGVGEPIPYAEDAMQPGDADVVDQFDPRAEDLRR